MIMLVLTTGAVAFWILREDGRRGTGEDPLAPLAVAAGDEGRPEQPLREPVPSERSPVEALSQAQTENALAGRVLDPSLRPIKGARVFVAPVSERRAGPLYVEVNETESWHRVEGFTADDGRFHFRNLRPGSSRVALWADEFAPRELNQVVVPRSGEVDLGDVTLVAGVILEGRVEDPGGEGVAGARIDREEGGGGAFFGSDANYSALASADDEGRFRTRASHPGDWVIRIESDRHPPAWFDVAARVPGVSRGHVFKLEASWSISGRLVVPGVSDLSAYAVRIKYAGEPRLLPGLRDEHRHRTVRCGAEGSFQCDRLRAADATAQYELEGLRVYEGHSLRITEPVRTVVGSRDVVLSAEAVAGLIFELRAADDDRAIEEPIVYMLLEQGNRIDLSKSGSLLELGPGRYRVPDICRASGIEALAFEIRKEGFKVCSLYDLGLSVGAERDLGTIRMQAAAVLAVLVVDEASGQPVAGAEVLRDSNDAPYRVPRDPGVWQVQHDPKSTVATTDSTGVATVAMAADYVNQVRVVHPDYAPAISDLLMAGQESELLRIDLARGATLDVLVESAGEGLPGAEVMVASPDFAERMTGLDSSHRNTRRFAETDTTGIARFQHVPAGWTEIARTGGDDASMRRILLKNEMAHKVVISADPEVSASILVRETGEALPGAEVILYWAGSDGPLWRQMRVVSGVTDSTGRVFFEGLAMGEYRLLIVHGTRDLGSTHEIELRQNGAESVVDLERAEVAGRLLTAEGEPVADCPVYILEERSADKETLQRLVSSPKSLLDFSSRGSVGESRTDSSGRFAFRGLSTRRMLVVTGVPPEGTMAEPLPFRLRPWERLTLSDLITRPAGVLSLRLEVENDDPRLYRASLVPLESIDGRYCPEDVVFGQSGFATFRHLLPGSWRVLLYSRFGNKVLSEERVKIVGMATTELTVRPEN